LHINVYFEFKRILEERFQFFKRTLASHFGFCFKENIIPASCYKKRNERAENRDGTVNTRANRVYLAATVVRGSSMWYGGGGDGGGGGGGDLLESRYAVYVRASLSAAVSPAHSRSE